MIEYQITGRTRNKARLESFIESVIITLLPYPYKRKVEIDIEIVPTIDRCHNNYAECDGDRNAANIVLSRRDEYNELFSERLMALNVAHELVHAKQFIKGQLSTQSNNQDYWMGRKCLTKSTNRQPWEKEAYSMEETLVGLFW
jgi:hypothetical protein|tara:strand:+ start:322 stop:750 length:429 start_codon:yes stop_codon:yes gene_type:complete